ncbi:LacI family DNA-binding transcriptional regulator [Nitratireductor kimnyeongensis]|uniref:LacI family DNA-binding transcriptional regulator n=1 Tax=Nitratireductor kimnyeongensis TaxID=430679 RepID=A0ABW0TD35_9HYPH|nr:LacI family DNA-binding transcriptional regulator [Nitratireductor kimnyeongensis]QZZ36961.1 LacI family transcriptional regulator [Nitratireductor kimnyeongensis]
MAKIKDVAAKAGVSTATVSHVINGSRTVSPATTKKVRAAIKALKYRPHGIARSLRVAQTGTIAVLISDISNPFFADFVRGVEDAAHQSGERYHLLLCNTEESTERERRALDLVLERRIDGIIMAPAGGNEEILIDLAESGMPLIFGDRELKGVPADTVVADNVAAAAELTRHLISLGHERIALLEADLNASAIDERTAGFRQALAKAGLKLDPRHVGRSPSNVVDAEAAGKALLGTEPRPDAVFCTNNFMTLGMMQAVMSAGLRCPQDIAVVGFDDFPWAAAFSPRLTVVAQPAHEIGREAAALLFDRLSGRRTGDPVQLTLATRLIVRDSCGAGLKSSRS